MQVELGDAGLDMTFQEPFELEVNCIHPGCGGRARIAFVAHELLNSGQPYVTGLHDNVPDGDSYPDGYWVHDACAVAVYFCRKCLKTTAEMNQA